MSTPTQNTATKQLVVGVADLQLSNDPNARIITYALGSCIGVTAWDRQAKIGGMLHFMLPEPPEKAGEGKQAMYATSGITALFDRLAALGARRENLVVCAAGAAEIMSGGGLFAVGQRNRTMMRKIFWRLNVVVAGEDTGGNSPRTMTLDVGSGEVVIKAKGADRVLWHS